MAGRPRRVTPESLVASFVSAAAAMMAIAYLLDAAGLPIAPPVLAAAAGIAAVAAFLAVRESAPAPAGSLVGFAAVVSLFLAYLVWLASPSLLPITDGPDLVHHLQLIHLIERTHHLAHDPALRPFLAEMADYTPGSHIVAALAGSWLGVDPLRVLFAVTAVFVAVKAGIVYALAVRVIPPGRAVAFQALAAPVLLLVPAGYVLGSFFKFYFFAQVVSETFAMAMILGAVGWVRTRQRAYLSLAAASGLGVVLAWPVWIVPVGVAVAAAILGGAMVPWRARVSAALVIFAPGIVFALWHALTHPSGASIVGSSGDVLRPSVAVLGAGFVALGLVGLVLAVRSAAARPLAVLLAAAVLLALALAPSAAPSYYMPSKMVYLAVLPCAVLGVVALASAASWLARVPLLGVAAPILPVLVAAFLAAGRYPVTRQAGPITEPSLAAGVWARAVLPAGCVDYFSRHWLTGYWLHLDVLGNPRDSDRMRAETFVFHDTVGRWIEGRGLPYAIVEDLSAIPRDARVDMVLLREFPPAAVVKNARPGRLGSDPDSQLCGGK